MKFSKGANPRSAPRWWVGCYIWYSGSGRVGSKNCAIFSGSGRVTLFLGQVTKFGPACNSVSLCNKTRNGRHKFQREPSPLLRQSRDWCSEEDDRQAATCPQLGSTNRLEHAQVRPGTHSFPAKSAILAGCCRPGSVQSLRPGAQMSAQDGSWIPVYLLPTRLRHLWPSPPAIGWPWSSRFPTRETCFVRRTFICICRPFELGLSLPAYLRDSSLSLSSFKRHLKTFLFSFY